MTNKKAIELTMNTIIIAALLLFLLVVMYVIFGRYMGKGVKALEDCYSKGGTCEPCDGKWDTKTKTCLAFSCKEGPRIFAKCPDEQVCCAKK